MSDVPTTDTSPPVTIGGRYILGELIGRGGAADVFRARDELLGRDVAIKMFTAGGEVVAEARANGVSEHGEDAEPGESARAATDESSDTRHRREVLTLAGLSHPGLVTVYDVGDQAGRAYFVMQLIEGDTLAQRIRAGALPPADVVALGAALADALAYVHRRGVVHRDVKPGNVLLDTDGRPHLSDFGIAAVHDAAPVTAAGMVIGTASYLSPEQVRGEPVGAGVDVYALGLVLIECLTGRREYPGNALEAAVARLHRRPSIPAGLPGNLGELLDAMTHDDPAGRPTAEGVVGALRGISREVGMDAQTVLSPVLMTAPTSAMGPTSGPVAAGSVPLPGQPTSVPLQQLGPHGSGPISGPMAGSGSFSGPTSVVGPSVGSAVSAPGAASASGTSGTAPPAPRPRVRRHRRALLAFVVVLATLLVGGSAVAYAVLANNAQAVPASTATVPSVPPAPPPAAPTSSVVPQDQDTASVPTVRTRRVVPTVVPRPRLSEPVVPPPAAPPSPVGPPSPTGPPPGSSATPSSSPSTPTSRPSGRSTFSGPPTVTTSPEFGFGPSSGPGPGPGGG